MARKQGEVIYRAIANNRARDTQRAARERQGVCPGCGRGPYHAQGCGDRSRHGR